MTSRQVRPTASPWPVVMRDISVSEKYRGVKCDGIIYHRLVKYGGILSGGIGDKYTSYYVQFILALCIVLCDEQTKV